MFFKLGGSCITTPTCVCLNKQWNKVTFAGDESTIRVDESSEAEALRTTLEPRWVCETETGGHGGGEKKKKEKRKERTRASVFKQREEEKRKVLAGMI